MWGLGRKEKHPPKDSSPWPPQMMRVSTNEQYNVSNHSAALRFSCALTTSSYLFDEPLFLSFVWTCSNGHVSRYHCIAAMQTPTGAPSVLYNDLGSSLRGPSDMPVLRLRKSRCTASLSTVNNLQGPETHLHNLDQWMLRSYPIFR